MGKETKQLNKLNKKICELEKENFMLKEELKRPHETAEETFVDFIKICFGVVLAKAIWDLI